MFKLAKEHKAGIISGLVASIVFIYFLQPILNWTSSAVVKVMTLAGSAFIDKIYTQAASLQVQDYSFLWLTFAFGIVSWLFFSVGISLLLGRERVRRFVESPQKPFLKESGIARRVVGALYVFLGLFFVVAVSANFIQLKAIATFQQQMTAIAPYIDEAEEERIFSDWALMRTQTDYEEIQKDLRARANAAKITLPEGALYTATTL